MESSQIISTSIPLCSHNKLLSMSQLSEFLKKVYSLEYVHLQKCSLQLTFKAFTVLWLCFTVLSNELLLVLALCSVPVLFWWNQACKTRCLCSREGGLTGGRQPCCVLLIWPLKSAFEDSPTQPCAGQLSKCQIPLLPLKKWPISLDMSHISWGETK